MTQIGIAVQVTSASIWQKSKLLFVYPLFLLTQIRTAVQISSIPTWTKTKTDIQISSVSTWHKLGLLFKYPLFLPSLKPILLLKYPLFLLGKNQDYYLDILYFYLTQIKIAIQISSIPPWPRIKTAIQISSISTWKKSGWQFRYPLSLLNINRELLFRYPLFLPGPRPRLLFIYTLLLLSKNLDFYSDILYF